MAKRSNHYDVAFENFLRLMRRPYVAVDESKRALYQDSSLKSMDFVVYSQSSTNLLVDVKGRRFPQKSGFWENWTMQDDIHSLLEWEQVFGENFRSMLVFAYEVFTPREMEYHDITWEFRQRRYAFYGVWTQDYAAAMKTRSSSWQTVNLGAHDYRKLRHPILSVL
ncbi:HYExAFE family protein [Thalassoglobus sp.]|uniref:HYExAFE family protein n=1 Tax=Thalassoglobus sp. TaxID=2795869 RepID=UPI003AA9B8EA